MRVLSFALLVSMAGLASGQSFVYVNDDGLYDALTGVGNANTVSALAVQNDGSLSPVPGTPFQADEDNFGCFVAGFAASPRITTAGDFLYAENCYTGTISGFSIDPTTGVLALLDDSPFALVPAPYEANRAFGLTATPDGRFVIAVADTDQLNQILLHAWEVGATGALTAIAGSPFAVDGCPSFTGMTVSPDGRFLAVACPFPETIYMFTLGPGGVPTPAPGSPFLAVESFAYGIPSGLDINCAGDRLFVTFTGALTSTVGVYAIAADGSLAPIAGSPFQPAGGGAGSQVGLLSKDDQTLFVSNLDSNSVTSFSLAPDGSPSPVVGSPFLTTGFLIPAGMGTDPTGSYLYVTTWDPFASLFDFGYVYAFSIGAGGVLTSIPGAATGALQSTPFSLTVYPPTSCGDDDDGGGGDLTLAVDIKFCSDPNGYNCKAKGVVPVTLFGTPDVDVSDLVVASLRLCLASDPTQCTGAPKSWSFDDRGDPGVDIGAAACSVVEGVTQRYRTQDGRLDLDAAFDNSEVSALIGCDSLAKGAASPTLIVTGQTQSGDSVVSVPVGDEGVDRLLIQAK